LYTSAQAVRKDQDQNDKSALKIGPNHASVLLLLTATTRRAILWFIILYINEICDNLYYSERRLFR